MRDVEALEAERVMDVIRLHHCAIAIAEHGERRGITRDEVRRVLRVLSGDRQDGGALVGQRRTLGAQLRPMPAAVGSPHATQKVERNPAAAQVAQAEGRSVAGEQGEIRPRRPWRQTFILHRHVALPCTVLGLISTVRA